MGPAKLREILSLPFFYNALQYSIGVPRQREYLVRRFVRPRKGDRILDIGCGTADVLIHLEPFDIRYTGIDPNEAYVAHAQQRWGDDARYEFRVAAVGTNPPPPVDADAYDTVIAFGVMHHLTDGQVRELLRLAAHGLRPGGRLVTMDPCRLPDMNIVERLAVRYDRGACIREASDYEALVKAEFPSATYSIRAMARVPSRAVVFVGEAAARG